MGLGLDALPNQNQNFGLPDTVGTAAVQDAGKTPAKVLVPSGTPGDEVKKLDAGTAVKGCQQCSDLPAMGCRTGMVTAAVDAGGRVDVDVVAGADEVAMHIEQVGKHSLLELFLPFSSFGPAPPSALDLP